MAKALDELNRVQPISTLASDRDPVSGIQEVLRQLTESSPQATRGIGVVHISQVLTPLGPMLLGTWKNSVCLLEFVDRVTPTLEKQLRRLVRRLNCGVLPGPTEAGRQVEGELEEYFAGRLRTFSTPVYTPGTDFQQRAWSALCKILFGETRSYAEQARMIETPEAVRAVARANGANRIAILIPCHRVIGANGTLTGYGGGLWRKRWLLEHERRIMRPEQQAELF